jgi:hypothetical protein
MLEVCKFQVRSLDVSFLELSWQILNTSEDVLDYTFQMLRSESEFGPWDILSPPFSDRYVYFDRTANVLNKQRNWYYRIHIVNKVTGEEDYSDTVTHQAPSDLITLEVRRHMMILFHEFAGRRCWLLPRRTFGQRCKSCWNAALATSTRSRCIDCFDTGFARGYLAPIEVWAQIDPGGNQVLQRTNVGALQPLNTTARFAGPDGVKPTDMLIEAENKRWRVIFVNEMEHGRATIHHELQLHEIPKSDIEYAVPLPLEKELRDMHFSPSRNFTNPHNLANVADDAFEDIMALYGGPIHK